MKLNDDFKPTCQAEGCGSLNFVGKIAEVDRADKPIGLLSCVECGTVVGAFPGALQRDPEQPAKTAAPKSSCCGSHKFVAYLDRYSSGFIDQPALILCGDCEKTVVGNIPSDAVWKDY
ncbi:hypothetical protein GEV39_16770 [Pseudomonas sp. NY5710]|uniref:hypothetical protein n=1 Tax=Pseudomonas sp. NY5710 TaxID=2662033 RepID=UPI0015708E25|nr:hypothetical protein [Pseudomonas sp. NY5710]QKL02932.1 hypothetical protein GEV39_16770 [Pseudomonas sp. NY5710]